MVGLAVLPLAADALAQGAPAPAPVATPTPQPTPPTTVDATTPPAELAGSWDLRLDGATIFRFTIERTASGGWQGRWQRPDSFNSNGNAFANLRGGVKSTVSMTALAVGQMVELAFDDPRPGAVPDIFRFRLIGSDAVAMGYVGTQLPPYLLVRAAPDAPLGNWDSTKVYRRPMPGAPTTAAPVPASPAPAAPAATPAPAEAASAAAARAASPPPPQVIQPSPDGRIILGPQVRFLDLTPRQAEEEGETSEAGEGAGEAEETAPATAGSPPAPAPRPTPAPTAAPSTPAPAPAPTEPGIGADFLEGL